MPTYGYRCTVCKHEFERVQKISDPALTECESCGEPVKKILYPVGIQFKGSGFYVNDYSKSGGSEKKSETTAPPAESKTDTKSETKTETKTETKSEAKPAPPAAATS